MAKAKSPVKSKAVKASKPATRKPYFKAKSAGKRQFVNSLSWTQRLPLLLIEGFGILLTITLTSMYALGYAAKKFNGLSFWEHLLPFTLGIVAWIISIALLLLVWLRIHQRLGAWFKPIPAMLSFCLGASSVWYASQQNYEATFSHFRTLVGGKQQAERTTLAHQVFAAYRRYDLADVQKIIDRSQTYQTDIKAAANSFDLDLDIMLGIAATESSFLPRDSFDGGHGLFQITQVPSFLLEQAKQKLAVNKLSVPETRHNAYIAAATLKHYLAEMHNDLFLGLLAYNIGPKNGGLKFIMQQYGASDFVTMQPYLQQLPRDYPIRVLSYALAFRLWHQQGKLLAYQEGDNAVLIQHVGIPGLLSDY